MVIYVAIRVHIWPYVVMPNYLCSWTHDGMRMRVHMYVYTHITLCVCFDCMCIFTYLHMFTSTNIMYQYGPTGSVDREFVDIVREKKRKRGKE